MLVQLEQGNASEAYSIYDTFAEIQPLPYTQVSLSTLIELPVFMLDQNVYNRSMQRHETRESLRPILCGDAAPTNISIDSYVD